FEGFEALHALRREHVPLGHLVPDYPPAGATPHDRAGAVVVALRTPGTRHRRAASPCSARQSVLVLPSATPPRAALTQHRYATLHPQASMPL
ncbi:MAG: hypothetical protein M3442_05105, partial [Chloroflexota bacterium]|nr:hypothetical protein [Chloroflexota bacterium]